MNYQVYFNLISRFYVGFLLLSTLASYWCQNSVVESCMEEERRALLSFKHGLSDPSGRLSSWVGDQCCRWRGISCNNLTGRVVKMDLRNPYPFTMADDEWVSEDEIKSEIGGKINPSLLALKHLSYLDLSSNDFGQRMSYQIPSFIGQLTSLKYLNLSETQFFGEIPPSLGNLSNLNYLDLSTTYTIAYVYSKEINWLSGLSSIKYLNLRMVDLSTTRGSLPHQINMLPSLLELHLSLCQIDESFLWLSPTTSMNMTSLLVLDLSWNNLKSSFPNWIFNLTSLTELILSENPFSSPSLDEFVRLKTLEHLQLGNVGLTGQVPKLVENLCRLKSLSLGGNKFDGGFQEFMSGFSNCLYNRMESLDLSFCGLASKIPSSFVMLKSLQHLYLNFNSFWGPYPEFVIKNLTSLKTLDFSSNHFNGSIPSSLGQQSQLISLDLSENQWDGTLTEAHFINLTSLKMLSLSTNQLEPILFNFTNYEWIPPFKLHKIYIENCRVGPDFPLWLQSQTELSTVALPNTGISDPIPVEWLFKISSKIMVLNLANNQLRGKLPFQFIFPRIQNLDLSNNQFNGTIPPSICDMQSIWLLSLKNNYLSGTFPREWGLWSNILLVDVSNNNLSGNIPTSMGIPRSLQSLRMTNNHFTGEIPSSLQNCSDIWELYLGGNQLTGKLPVWIGSDVTGVLEVLELRSNRLNGHIPQQLCNLPRLIILDLAHNNFSGIIPKCLNNLTSLFNVDNNRWIGYKESTSSFTLKGRDIEFAQKTVRLLTIVDLSSNNLEGEIPEEISYLTALANLNLSMNQLSGNIPLEIGKMQLLESLDLSQNKLSGDIPPSLSNLTFLARLNLSHNNLSGRIPSGNQLQTLDDSSIYEDNNPSLCGFPLPTKCSDEIDDTLPAPAPEEDDKDHEDVTEKFGLYVSVVLGFIIGFWSVCGSLILKKPWRYAYFQFFDNIKENVALRIDLGVAHWKRRHWQDDA